MNSLPSARGVSNLSAKEGVLVLLIESCRLRVYPTSISPLLSPIPPSLLSVFLSLLLCAILVVGIVAVSDDGDVVVDVAVDRLSPD